MPRERSQWPEPGAQAFAPTIPVKRTCRAIRARTPARAPVGSPLPGRAVRPSSECRAAAGTCRCGRRWSVPGCSRRGSGRVRPGGPRDVVVRDEPVPREVIRDGENTSRCRAGSIEIGRGWAVRGCRLGAGRPIGLRPRPRRPGSSGRSARLRRRSCPRNVRRRVDARHGGGVLVRDPDGPFVAATALGPLPTGIVAMTACVADHA